jgi:hypothetical protein
MRFFYLLTSMVLLGLSASAQSNYKPGYLVNTKGDTTRGFINYREWDNNPESIDFKTTLADNNKQKIAPADVAGFSITGLTTYQTYSGRVSTDESNGNRVANSRDTSFIITDIFLKVLQKGKNATLYSYQDQIKTRYFISEDAQPPKELIYHLYYAAGQNGTITESTYKKQLSVIAGKHNLLDDKLNLYIQRSEYSYSNILSVVSKLNDMKVAKEDNVITANYFYAGIGVNITSFTTDGEYKKAGGKPYTSIMPMLLAGVNVYANPNTQNLAFRFELGIGANRYESNYKNQVLPYNDVVFHFTQLSASLTPQVLYNFYNQPNFKFYGAIGMQVSYNQYVDKAFQNKDGTAFSSFSGAVFDFNKVFANPLVKAGFTINKKINIYASYIPVTNVNVDPYFLISYTTVQAGINYLF